MPNKDRVDLVSGEPIEWPTVTFWKHSTEETFNKRYNVLRVEGFSSKEAFEFLEDLYYAVGAEYGA